MDKRTKAGKEAEKKMDRKIDKEILRKKENQWNLFYRRDTDLWSNEYISIDER